MTVLVTEVWGISWLPITRVTSEVSNQRQKAASRIRGARTASRTGSYTNLRRARGSTLNATDVVGDRTVEAW